MTGSLEIRQETGVGSNRDTVLGPAQVDLLRRTLAHDCTPDEFELFVAVVRQTGLNPFARQIWPIKRKRYNADTSRYEDYLSVETGIDGTRLIAERTGERDGEDPPMWCGTDGKWTDVWTKDVPPYACKVAVYRKGHSRPYIGIAYFDFYKQTKKNGEPTGMWARGAPNMLAKCAEQLALRKAFPQETAAVTSAETAHVEPPAAGMVVELPDDATNDPLAEDQKFWQRAYNYAKKATNDGEPLEQLVTRFWQAMTEWWTTNRARASEALDDPASGMIAVIERQHGTAEILGIPKGAVTEFLDAQLSDRNH